MLLDVVSPHPEMVEVVGVVGECEFGLTAPGEPVMYLLDASPEMEIVIQSAGANAALGESISATLQRVNPQQAVGPVTTIKSYVAASLAQ